jgi:hypothetical protein
MAEPDQPDKMGRSGGAEATKHGPGRVLILVYGIFALAATSRAAVQIATRFSEARIAYLLSAVAAVIYCAATFALARATDISRRVAAVAIAVELVGVVGIGAFSYAAPEDFPDATVCSCSPSSASFGSVVRAESFPLRPK